MSYVTLVPTYGRDYKSKKEVLSDWNGNKDFRIQSMGHPHDGASINKQDAEKTPGVTYNIRYKKLTQVCPVKV
jgi:hypothetical protein